ncbi:MAG TPA: trypsin-like peptidase domain-containing protein [Blastocatellia bacterium]|nr:trypsin-like peptidase domain-containing protein [Blastocatellia bacterium]
MLPRFHEFALATLALSLSVTQLAPAQTGREVARYALSSVVVIVAEKAKGKAVALGSGFFVGDGVIVTNYHVIKGASRLRAKIVGQKSLYPINQVLIIDVKKDLALVRVAGVRASALSLGDDSRVATGDEIYVVGNPEGLEGTFSKGVISGIRSINGRRYLQITAPISPGSSGGPVLNAGGEVIGVAVGSLRTGQNLNFAIPASDVTSLLAGALSDVRGGGQSNEPFADIADLLDKPATPRKLPSNTMYGTKEISQRQREVRTNPISAEAHFKLAEAYRRWHRKVEAIKSYSHVIQLDPAYADAHYGLAESYMMALFSAFFDRAEIVKQSAMAAEAYKRAIRLKPDYFEAHLGLAQAYSSLSRFDEAIEACKVALSINPASTSALRELGSDYSILERYPEAIEAYKRAFEIDPTGYRGLYDIGRVHLKQKQYQDAIRMYERGLRIVDDGSVTLDEYYNLWEAYKEADRVPSGIEYFAQLVTETKISLSKFSSEPRLPAFSGNGTRPPYEEVATRRKLAWLYRSLGNLYVFSRNKPLALEQYKALRALGTDGLVESLASDLFDEIYK